MPATMHDCRATMCPVALEPGGTTSIVVMSPVPTSSARNRRTSARTNDGSSPAAGRGPSGSGVDVTNGLQSRAPSGTHRQHTFPRDQGTQPDLLGKRNRWPTIAHAQVDPLQRVEP